MSFSTQWAYDETERNAIMANRNALLNKLVIPLVEEWGIDAVEAALKCLARQPVIRVKHGTKTRPVTKLLASEQVARMQCL